MHDKRPKIRVEYALEYASAFMRCNNVSRLIDNLTHLLRNSTVCLHCVLFTSPSSSLLRFQRIGPSRVPQRRAVIAEKCTRIRVDLDHRVWTLDPV